jgi:hypothetical protein
MMRSTIKPGRLQNQENNWSQQGLTLNEGTPKGLSYWLTFAASLANYGVNSFTTRGGGGVQEQAGRGARGRGDFGHQVLSRGVQAAEIKSTSQLCLSEQTSIGLLAEIFLSQTLTVIVAGLLVAAVLH